MHQTIRLTGYIGLSVMGDRTNGLSLK